MLGSTTKKARIRIPGAARQMGERLNVYISICCGNVITIFYVTAPSCNPERAICRKCGEAPIEVARLADDGTREVQVFKYDINGNVIGQDTRIIGGDKASPLEYPYQAALVKGSGLLFLCGASIITREWVLTAAHCLAPLQGDYSDLLVGIGNTFRDLMLYMDAKRVIIHEDYNDLRIEDGNDIALIQLPARLNFDQNPSVQPVCLAEAEDLVIGQDMVNTGWGLLNTSKKAIPPNELYEVTLTQMDVKVCRRSGDVPRDQKKVICTVNTDKSSCKGDSGGPLVVQLCDGRWVQTGIVSYSIGLCSGINLFTSVPYYRDWIIDNIKPTYFC
ncbi:tryptase beta-2-like [Scylla paramamosain]|uniref:tryptase beta-2-like n=1 Tax=Scylla paramamosain TaxID=85552 RepID=UPI00308329E5